MDREPPRPRRRRDWGTKVTPGNGSAPVKETIFEAFGVTARLVVGAELIALTIGVAIGVLGAVRQYSISDYTATGIAFVMFSMPLFCAAIMTTVFTLNLGALITGAIITETVFGWHGLGQVLLESVRQKEPYMVLGFLMVTAITIIVLNLVADIVYAILDPRVRLD